MSCNSSWSDNCLAPLFNKSKFLEIRSSIELSKSKFIWVEWNDETGPINPEPIEHSTNLSVSSLSSV